VHNVEKERKKKSIWAENPRGDKKKWRRLEAYDSRQAANQQRRQADRRHRHCSTAATGSSCRMQYGGQQANTQQRRQQSPGAGRQTGTTQATSGGSRAAGHATGTTATNLVSIILFYIPIFLLDFFCGGPLGRWGPRSAAPLALPQARPWRRRGWSDGFRVDLKMPPGLEVGRLAVCPWQIPNFLVFNPVLDKN
jgi:hypothetical protein